jgi:HK97 family phage major capsid protein
VKSASERIDLFKAERLECVSRMSAITSLADEDGRDALNETEEAGWTKAKDRIDTIDRSLVRLDVEENLSMQRAAEADPVVTDAAIQIEVLDPRDDDPSLLMVQRAAMMYRAGGNPEGAAEIARSYGDPLLEKLCRVPMAVLDKVRRADQDVGDTTTATWAAELVEWRRASEQFIELLRPQSILMQLANRTMDFGTNRTILIPRQDGGATAAWVAEGAPAPVGALVTGEETMKPHKSMTLMAVTNELITYSSPSVLAIVRDDLVTATAIFLDTVLVSETARNVGTTPGGIFSTGANVLTGDSTVGVAYTRANVDIMAAQNAMEAANIPPGGWVWIMNPSNRTEAAHIQNDIGAYIYRDEILAGQLSGHGILTSTTMTADEVGLVSPNQLLVALGRNVQVDFSRDATIHMEDATPLATPTMSAYQTDSTVARVLVEVDWLRRHGTAFTIVNAVDWFGTTT